MSGPGNVNPLLATVRGLQHHLRYLSGYFDFDDRPVTRLTDFTNCHRPVLLLYGFFAARRTVEVLERRLRRDGYCVFSINLGGVKTSVATRGIDDLAETVRVKVERLYERNPAMGPLTVIGHSQGGLIGTYYVKKLGGWRRARALVTLGSPHNGTPAAYLGLPLGVFARSVLQMTPMSPFIRRLQRGAWPPGVRFSSLYSKMDGVAPFPSPLIETQGLPYVRNVEVPAHGHREFLYRKRIYDIILSELRSGEAPSPLRIRPLSVVQARALTPGPRAAGGEAEAAGHGPRPTADPVPRPAVTTGTEPAGMTTRNTAPPPSRSSTDTAPPCRSATSFTR
jgi:triacylglycerol lipase